MSKKKQKQNPFKKKGKGFTKGPKRQTKRKIEQPMSHEGRMQDDELFKRLPDYAKRAMEGLQKQEKRILEGLRNEENKRLFIVNPAAALTRMKIQVPPEFRKQLQVNERLEQLLQPKKFRLANGQVITAKVRINFTSGKKEE